METKQTAVEWLVKELNQELGYIPIKQWDRIRDLVVQAKEMEREQHEMMFNCGRQYQLTGEGTFKQTHEELYGN